MSADQNIKLIKIASEINIGKDAIVQFLATKGITIDTKPTTVLTPEMAETVYEKFKKEKKAAETQREKILKHKDIRKPAFDPKARKPELFDNDSIIETGTEIIIEDRIIEIDQIQPQPEIVIEEEPIPIEILAPIEISEPGIPRVGDKIDLRATERKGKPVLKSDKPSGKKRAEEQKPSKEIAAETRSSEEQRKAVEVTPKTVESVQKPKKDEPVQKKKKEGAAQEDIQKVIEIAPKPEVPQLLIPLETIPEIIDEITGAREDHKKKKKKRKKIIEVEYRPGATPKLRGLTIVGKIELDEHKEKAKLVLTRKGVEVEDDEDGEKSKLGKGKKKLTLKGGVKTGKEIIDKAEEKKRKKRKKTIREMITEEDVDRAIRETLAGMEIATHTSQRTKLRMKRKAEREEKELKISEEKDRESHILRLTEFVTTSDMAAMMGVTANEIILKCMQLGLMVTINMRLDKDTITLIADDYGFEVEFIEEKVAEFEEEEDYDDDSDDLESRSPIVTIMGHVDHGKTSLLDFIRKANVVAGESGGITQHIAAYRVELESKKSITFLDTPGHEAFTAMRARGAQVTDIVVLVVSADDSVMPQTIEAISHANAAKVPIIVAINKIDKPDAKPDRIRQQLTDHGILVEDWGGTNQAVEISAKFGTNVDLLLEKILLEAEILDLKANPKRFSHGTVIEAHMAKGLGIVSTVIVQKGTLNIGDAFIAGVYSGKVRAMLDERGNKVMEAGPSVPIGVIGFDGLPEAGDKLTAFEYDYDARAISLRRQQLKREQELRHARRISLDDISKQISKGVVKDLNLIIKGDVSGSVEALSDSLQKLSHDEVRVNIIHKGVGSITENDVMLALASGAVILGFHINATAKARKIADNESVDIRLYTIIYNCINEVQLALEGMLAPDIKEDVTSSVEIRKVFKISKLGAVAGCYVLTGKVNRNDKVRIMRNGLQIFTGTIDSLKRGKDDVRDVEQGYECGIQLHSFNECEIGDILESYQIVEVKRTLS